MKKKSVKAQTEIPAEHLQESPPGWAAVQDELAARAGLSLLVVDGPQPPAVHISNNNSICHSFQTSPEFRALCDPYCGVAHQRALAAGTVVHYKCHAGLQCFAAPVPLPAKRSLAVIGGRAFVNTKDYRVLVERFRSGELKSLLPKNPFENVIFGDLGALDQLAENLEEAAADFEPAEAPPKRTIKSAMSDSEPAPIDATLFREVEQLRSELEYRSRLTDSLRHFLERISSAEPTETYNSILKDSKQLLQADRASLLVFDEISNQLTLKASSGLPAAASESTRMRLGEGISGRVIESAEAVVVANIEESRFTPAPAERNYKTKSFISYPITIGGRRIGVLNVSDKTGGGTYDDVDLSLLEIIGPTIAVALERAEWQERATEFQLMSITDSLTGLPNRRYLEERLAEELNRSKRYDYPMSFLMIDIDDFKTYNDQNGHQAGDMALQITAHCLKASLRSADVASRYGGEEFSILLPQTPINEAVTIAERIRQRVATTHYPHGKTQPLGHCTISIGISSFAQHIDTAETIIAAADRALYNAKREGKNRIRIYQDNLSGAANTYDSK